MFSNANSTDSMTDIQASAAALLLRSPRLSVTLIMDLLDLSDAEFRSLTRSDERIAELLDLRRRGELSSAEPEIKTCPGCDDWFIPYAGQRCCSDECTRIAKIQTRAGG